MSRPRPEPGRRGGYISLLAISLTVGLAIFAGAISTGTVHYIRATADEARDLQERIGLESAAAVVLGRAARGQPVPVQSDVTVNRRLYSVEISLPSRKVDLLADTEDTITTRATQNDLVIPAQTRRTADGLTDLSRRLRLNASGEDCLRAGFTYGRGGQPAGEGELPATLTVESGDQLDLRVSTETSPYTVLWLRARFTADGWALHDYRRLSDARCRS